jgi:hypothetical protein
MGALSGQKAVTTAGIELALAASMQVQCAVAVKALTTNTGLMYIGNAGDDTVSSITGFPLAAGDVIIFEYVDNLDNIWVDSAVNGEGVAYLVLHE